MGSTTAVWVEPKVGQREIHGSRGLKSIPTLSRAPLIDRACPFVCREERPSRAIIQADWSRRQQTQRSLGDDCPTSIRCDKQQGANPNSPEAPAI